MNVITIRLATILESGSKININMFSQVFSNKHKKYARSLCPPLNFVCIFCFPLTNNRDKLSETLCILFVILVFRTEMEWSLLDWIDGLVQWWVPVAGTSYSLLLYKLGRQRTKPRGADPGAPQRWTLPRAQELSPLEWPQLWC